MKEYYRNLLTFREGVSVSSGSKNIIWATITMDPDAKYLNQNPNRYITKTIDIDPKVLFSNEKLIFCLAYIMCDGNYEGENGCEFCLGDFLVEDEEIPDLIKILHSSGFMCYSSQGPCHSLIGLELIYYDEEGKGSEIGFDKIYERWDKMGYEEICEEINSISENESNS